jgi:hypothetical protein
VGNRLLVTEKIKLQKFRQSTCRLGFLDPENLESIFIKNWIKILLPSPEPFNRFSLSCYKFNNQSAWSLKLDKIDLTLKSKLAARTGLSSLTCVWVRASIFDCVGYIISTLLPSCIIRRLTIFCLYLESMGQARSAALEHPS